MKRTAKKLRLGKETLAFLEGGGVSRIHGGVTAGCGGTFDTCPCTLACGGTKGPSCVPTGCTQQT